MSHSSFTRVHIRLMTEADVPLGMRLKASNGWNQTEADWHRYLGLQPDGCFVAMLGGTPVGTLTTCLFGPVAWIAMVLVDAAYRGRGVGKALMRHALDFLESQGVRSIRLDATVLGQPLYEKLGFVAEYTLHRYEGTLQPGNAVAGVEPFSTDDVDALVRLDQFVTRTDRRKLLAQLVNEFPEASRVVRRSERLEGFCLARPGTRALHIGPCLATGSSGHRLLEDARRRYGGNHVFLDIPVEHQAAARWAEASGLT
ncbi:MAG TPA: GNAT family N-acetyltransferase, partial [Gemmataceae bacterium]|nr:GNAT family N-acetyltransferase [Gemmataceae bacterium]